jgi:hypothetical protein
MRNGLACLYALLVAASCTGELDIPDHVVATSPEAVTTPCTAANFGSCTIGGTMVTASADYKRASKFSLSTSNASVSKLTAYLDGLGATVGSQSVIGIVYAADGTGGAPGTLLCKTQPVTVAAGTAGAWTDLAVAGSCTLPSAGNYYLGLLTSPTEAVVRYFGSSSAGSLAVNSNSFASGPSSTFGSFSTVDVQMSINATFTAGSMTTGTFGKTAQGALMNTASGDVKRANAFTLTVGNATVSKLSAFLDGAGATTGSQTVMGVVYAADGASGAPGTLLCQTSALSITAGRAAGWVDLPVAGTCVLPSAGTYYLGLLTGQTSAVARYGYDAVTGAGQYSANVFTSGPSNPWGATTAIDVQLAVYATYSASASSAPMVSLSTTSLAFASQQLGTTSAAQAVTVTNTGGAALSMSPAVTGDFKLASSSTCGASLAAGASCQLAVTFAPTASGARTGTLSITDNAAGSPHTVALMGTASSSSTCPTGSTTFYVATTGSDSNAGTSASPFRTITYAYSKATAGTVIIVMPGTYTDYQSGWGLHLGSSGTASAPITLCSQTRGAAIIDGQNLTDRNEAIYIDGSFNVVDGFVITRGPVGGISIWGNGNQILRNEIHHNGNTTTITKNPTNGQDGVYSNEGTANNNYEQNYIHDNGRTTDATYYKYDHGLYLCGHSELVIDNISVKNASMGLQIAGYTTVTGMKVYNNVLSFNGGSGIVIWQAMNGVEIKNNIIFGNQKNGIYDCGATGSGVVIDHNVIFGNNVSNGGYANLALTDQCGTGLTFGYTLGTTVAADPLFANASTSYAQQSDFQLRTGSPAIDVGLALSAVQVDITGAARPQGAGYDLGAYER